MTSWPTSGLENPRLKIYAPSSYTSFHHQPRDLDHGCTGKACGLGPAFGLPDGSPNVGFLRSHDAHRRQSKNDVKAGDDCER
jgi:hypothetical protein